jgi:hypothetical protein
MANAKAEGRELTDPEREKGRALTVRKEEMMRLSMRLQGNNQH